MPGTQSATYPTDPSLRIFFYEDSHVYRDCCCRRYISFTTLIHNYFPEFDAKGAAERQARKDGREVAEIMAEWDRTRREASEYGTRTHENCEYRMKGLPEPNQPRSTIERMTFATAAAVVDDLKRRFQFLAAEKILFSPHYRVAGTVDLLMASGDTLLIFDYKTNKAIKNSGYEKGLPPIRHLDNCNFEQYALQLSLAEVIARHEGYIPKNSICRRSLIHFPPAGAANFIEMPNRSAECLAILEDFRKQAHIW